MSDDPLQQLLDAAADQEARDPDKDRLDDLMSRVHTWAELAAVQTQAAEPLLGPFIRRKWRTIVVGHTGEGKALALGTPIPTPDGWKTMGDLEVGDQVFDENGKPCNVVAVSPTWENRPVFRVSARGGNSIIADAAHEWTLRDGSIVETRDMSSNRHQRSCVKMHGALELPEAELPIHPYLLGVWLGDGATSQAVLHLCSEEKMEHIGARVQEKEERFEYRVRDSGKALSVCGGFLVALRELGIIGKKHIPAQYLRASAEQRMELLRGLVDTDGYVSERGQVEVVSVKAILAADITELVRSLGVRVGLTSGPAMIAGRYISEKYRVRFRMDGCATLPRKAARTRNAEKYTDHYLTAEPAGRSSTRCIQVDSERSLFLAGIDMIPTHNSTLVTRMAGALATGGKFLGYRATECRVLIIDVEQDEAMAQERIGETLLGPSFNGDTLAAQIAEIPEAHNAFYCRWSEGVALDEQTIDRKALQMAIDKVKPDVVILDPIYRTFVGNPNEPVLAAQVMRFLDAMREDYGFALVIPMHPRKEQQGVTAKRLTKHDAYGGGGWIWGAEMILGIERMPGSTARLSFFKDRSGGIEPDTQWMLSYDKAQGFTRVKSIDPDGPSSTEEQILGILRDAAGDFFDKAMLAEMTRKPERTVRNALVDISRGKAKGRYPRLTIKKGAHGANSYCWDKAKTLADDVDDMGQLLMDEFDAEREDGEE